MDAIGMFAQMLRAGFTMEQIKKYARLQRHGGQALRECKGMLETQKRQLWLQISGMQESINFLERVVEVLDKGEAQK